MHEVANQLGLTQPAIYVIRAQGEPRADWGDWFGEMNVVVEDGVITMIAAVVDQPALHGLLRRIRDLRLPLLSVKCLRGEDGSFTWSPDQVEE